MQVSTQKDLRTACHSWDLALTAAVAFGVRLGGVALHALKARDPQGGTERGTTILSRCTPVFYAILVLAHLYFSRCASDARAVVCR